MNLPTTKVSTPQTAKSIASPPILFQATPAWGDPVRHGFRWTTWNGWIKAAKRRTQQLLTNCAIISKKIGKPWHYPYDGTITVLQQLTVPEHRKLWKAIASKLEREGCVATWDREITTKNIINYHLTFRDAPAELMANRGRKLKALLRPLTPHKLNMQFREIPDFKACINQCNYVTKAKKAGFKKRQRPTSSDDVDVVINSTNAETSPDIYAKKRVLFVKGCGLQKNNDFGNFWERKTKDMNEDYKARKEAKAKKASQNPYIEPAAKALAEMTDYHEEYIQRHLEAEIDANPNEKDAINAMNKALANDYYRSRPEYEEDMAYHRKQEAKHEHQRKINKDLDTLQRTKRKAKIPFNPENLDSVVMNA